MRTASRLPVIIGAFAIVAVLNTAPAAAEEADWTVMVLLSADYDNMEESLSSSGSSDKVNVLVLHDRDGTGTVAYRLLPDTNSDHHAGECCPSGSTPCCQSENLPLSEIGIDETDFIFHDGVIDRFFEYVQENYPAKRYLLSVRGQMDGVHLLGHNWDWNATGISIVELAAILERFTERHGSKLDVLNIGLCLGGGIDWAYAVSPYAEYYVGSPNFTNPPVSVRWRIYRWVRELIRNPSLTGRQIAVRIPDIFAEETDWCATNGCSNAPSEPWTVSAIDLAKLGDVAAASKDLVCSLTQDFAGIEQRYEEALAATTSYGKTSGSYRRPDLKHLAMNLEERIGDPSVDGAAEHVIDAVEQAVVASRYEPGYFDGHAYGLSALTPRSAYDRSSYVAEFGQFQVDSMWRLLLDTDHGGGSSPTITDLDIDPAQIDATVGDRVQVQARAVSEEYGPMCAVPVDWDKSDVGGVGVISSDANPTTFEALVPGTGVLRALFGDASAEASITVVRASSSPGGDAPEEATTGGGNTGDTPQASSDEAPTSPSEEDTSSDGCSESRGRQAGIPVIVGLALLLVRRRRYAE